MLTIEPPPCFSIIGVTSLNVDQVPGRDSLRLSSASRALTTSVDRLPRDGWSSQRGESLSGGEIQDDIDALDEAKYHVKIGVYSNSTYDLDLSIPSFSSNGYVWMRWKQPLQDYLEANNTDLQEHILLLNALLSDADPVLKPVQDTIDSLKLSISSKVKSETVQNKTVMVPRG